MQKNDKIYIAGHRGLVGSAILRKFQQSGYENLIFKNSKELDLTNQQQVNDFFSREKPQYVILAAAKVGGIIANNTYRADFIYCNTMIQSNVIHACYVHKVKKMIFLGSTCIYPKNCPQPMKEEYLLTAPLERTNEPYAIAKINGLKMCEAYYSQYNCPFFSIMPTNLYGENDNFDLEKSHVLPALLRKIYLAKLYHEESQENWQRIFSNLEVTSKEEALKIFTIFGIDKKKVEIWGTGKPMREFLHVDDLADACFFLMDKKDLIGDSHINVGSNEEISIKNLANLIQKIIGYEGEFFFNTDKPDGTMRKKTDLTRINSLGWKNTINLKEGIKKVYNWYKNQ